MHARQCQVYGDLFRLVVQAEGGGVRAGASSSAAKATPATTVTWSRFVCKGGPKARSSHQAVREGVCVYLCKGTHSVMREHIS